MSRLRTVLSFVFAITILSQCSPLLAENAVPVVMWGDSATSNSETTAVNPFVKTTRNEFNEFLSSALKERPPVLALLLDNLCVEDIVRYKKQFQETIREAKYTYIPLVEQASSAFQELPMYNRTDDVDAETISDGQLLIKPIASLETLSDLVREINSPRMVVVLTGKACGYRKSERVRRQATKDSKELIIGTNRVLFYASGPMQLKKGSVVAEELFDYKFPNDSGAGTTESPLVLHMQFDGKKSTIDLDFIFAVKSAGYYTLTTVEYTEDGQKQTLKATSNMVFPFNFSYHCSQMTTFKTDFDPDDKDKEILHLTIADFQVEIDGLKNRFGDAYDCVGFTTIPIWTGLFVTAILAAIMIWGLSMIIDIRTMDRFDDPKGKTITISAQE